ncbi:protein NEGATIVE GRAVITROPIC RESPONSE OF ROOTS-like [Capsicum chacoense]
MIIPLIQNPQTLNSSPSPPLFKKARSSASFGLRGLFLFLQATLILINTSSSVARLKICQVYPSLKMKIFNWIQNKINGMQSTNKSNPVAVTNHTLHQSCKEEFSDWPNELLAIGTFGSLKDGRNLNQSTCHPDQSLTAEEVGQLHKELKHLFPEESTPLSAKLGSEKDLEKFFDCLQNMVDDDHRVLENKESTFKRCNSFVRGKGQESAQLENTHSVISKKSLSYLLKKTLFCSAGFAAPPPHPLRDPALPQAKFEKSRMEKILRAILHKKIYPQATSPRGTTTRKRYLDNRCVIERDIEDEAFESIVKDGSKWDKSNSDFIVLEI